MAIHNYQCPVCESIRYGVTVADHVSCLECPAEMEILWSFSGPRVTSVNPTERIVVYENPATGEVKYPPRNDQPIPAQYAKQGFQKRELSTLAEVHKFEKEKGVRSERAWFDKGSGRDFDSAWRPGKLTPKDLERVMNGR
jgi:hypothetical protein